MLKKIKLIPTKYTRRYRANRIRQGMCVTAGCANIPEKGILFCLECAKKTKTRIKQCKITVEKNCVLCGTICFKKRCSKCERLVKKQRKEKQRAREYLRSKRIAQERKLQRKERKELGLCIECAIPIPTANYCKDCLAKRRKNVKNNKHCTTCNEVGHQYISCRLPDPFAELRGVYSRSRIYQLRNKSLGLCIRCKNPATKDKFCELHWEKEEAFKIKRKKGSIT